MKKSRKSPRRKSQLRGIRKQLAKMKVSYLRQRKSRQSQRRKSRQTTFRKPRRSMRYSARRLSAGGIPICPITHEPVTDPVIDPDGYTYERSAIEEWIRLKGESPITRRPLRLNQLVPNRAVREEINLNRNNAHTLQYHSLGQSFYPCTAT